MAFLRAAGLVVPEEARFIIGLSELRNRLIHNIQGVAFSFSEYVSSLDSNQRQAFAKSFGYAYLESGENDRLILKDANVVFRDPKSAVFNGVKLILAIIKLQIETKIFEREAKEHRKTAYQYMKSLTTAL